MAKPKKTPPKKEPAEQQPPAKPEIKERTEESVLPATSGMAIILVTLLVLMTVTRYVLHKLEISMIDSTYMIYDTAITIVCSVGCLVFFNYIRVSEACEKAESPEQFPYGAPVGFLAGNPIMLWIETSIIMGLVFVGAGALLFKLIGIEYWSILPFLLYKGVYCLLMVGLSHWMVLGRMLQYDWLKREIAKKQQKSSQPFQAPENRNVKKR